MTYPQDLEARLGFDQIRALLQQYSLCSLGQNEVDRLSFLSDIKLISVLLNRTREMSDIMVKGESFPFSNYFDPTTFVNEIGPEGSFLEEEIFHQIILSLQSVFGAKALLQKSREIYPQLALLADDVLLPERVLKELQSKFDDTGKIRDNATPELAKIRRKLNEERARIRTLADQLFRRASAEGWVPDGVSPTIRDGRIVLPILAEHKRRMRGHVVDESSTGQTIYLEPAEVLEANNELHDLIVAERREVVKILKELTNVVRVHLHEFRSAYHFLGLLDFNRAKAKLSATLESQVPHLHEGPYIDWINARHPLLFMTLRRAGRTIIPLNVRLSAGDHFLLISGPNAGGKSVCLKTIGLLQYMIQCGLPVPLSEQSTMGIFADMFIDIGDQQSIENDLSTYSSHLQNMSYFLNHARDRSIVLMDELGAGTDPNFGGGIAQAILLKLVQNKVWGVATTHYYNLKVFASSTPGIVNGAMLFDAKKLQPQFMLELGKPGSSFALEIARKTGLPPETLSEAEKIIGSELAGLEDLIKSVGDEKLANNKKASELQRLQKELDEKVARYTKLNGELETKKKDILEQARQTASGLLKQTNREIEKTIRHIRENNAERKETRKVRDGLKDLQTKMKPTEIQQAPRENVQLNVGDKVKIRGQEVTGTLETINDGNATVAYGHLRIQVKLDQLLRSDLSEAKSSAPRSRGIEIHRRQSEFESTLDVRGKRVEEVIPLLTKFLDESVLLGQGEVRILHGKGEGVLRQVVRDELKRTRQVATFYSEHVDRGGDGITVVVLK